MFAIFSLTLHTHAPDSIARANADQASQDNSKTSTTDHDRALIRARVDAREEVGRQASNHHETNLGQLEEVASASKIATNCREQDMARIDNGGDLVSHFIPVDVHEGHEHQTLVMKSVWAQSQKIVSASRGNDTNVISHIERVRAHMAHYSNSFSHNIKHIFLLLIYLVTGGLLACRRRIEQVWSFLSGDIKTPKERSLRYILTPFALGLVFFAAPITAHAAARGITSSLDGTKLVAGQSESLQSSPDSGATWIVNTICGNGSISGSETCDDGNTLAGDGCDSTCQVESGYYCNGASPTSCCLDANSDSTCDCGDGTVSGPETCDDGNTNACDSCDNSCHSTIDRDQDGVQDACDNCINTNGYVNGIDEQRDSNANGVGDICEPSQWRQEAGIREWQSIASSSDGTKLAAVAPGGYIYTSADSGATWTAQTSAGQGQWYSITSSSDGTKLAAVSYGGYIYTSTNSGATWTAQTSAGQRSWLSITSSSDGTKLAAGANGGHIYTSTDSGASWTQQTSAGQRYWNSIASSSDGTKLAAGDFQTGYIYTSTDSGATWTAQTSAGQRLWYSITSSTDGTKLAATDYYGYMYTSSDSGATWTAQTSAGQGEWIGVTSSSDGTKLAAVAYDGYIHTSTDSGASWTAQTSSGQRGWYGVTSSSDGTKLAAVAYRGDIYTSTDSGATWTAQTSAGQRNWSSITSSSDGTKLAAVDNMVGYIYTSTNSGATWTAQTSAGQRPWISIASSSDGTKLAAVSYPGYIYTSTDSGATWTAQTSAGTLGIYSITSSSDGTKLAAVDTDLGYIYTSADSGATWTAQTSAGQHWWQSITSSSNGTKLAAAESGGYIYTSTDSGATWTEQTSAGQRNWASITSSSDGTKLAAGADGGFIYTSTDSGATWTEQTSAGQRIWMSIASSSDGTKLAAVAQGGFIYTSSNSGLSWMAQPAPKDSWQSIASSADGSRLVAGGNNTSITTLFEMTPAPTATPTATPTPTPTETPAPVATPTSTPSLMPTIPSPSSPALTITPPQASAGNELVIVSGQSINISVIGNPRYTVEIQVDGIVVGTALATTPGSGTATGVWDFNLPPLSAGIRRIVATFIDESGNRGAPSAPTMVTVLDAAPLDFSATGDTAITATRRVGSKMRFKTRRASQASWTDFEMTGRYPAPADYDNDGVTDLAAVAVAGNRLQWNIKRSSTGTTSTALFGDVGETIVSGCDFFTDGGSALAVFNSEQRKLSFRSFNNSTTQVVILDNLGNGNLLGCGDTDGDGKDEILFSVPRTNRRKAALAAFDTSGHRKLFTGYNQFIRGFVIRRGGTQVPLVAVLGGTTPNGRQIRIATMAGSFAFPLFYISRNATIGTGIFTHETTQQAPGVFWADNRSRVVYRRLLTTGAKTSSLFKLPEAFKLMRAQNISRTNRTVNVGSK